MISSNHILWHYLHWVPVIVAILIPLCIISTYLIAVVNEDVEPILPMVSDAGTRPPAAPLFSMLLIAIAFLMWITLLVRYTEIETIIENDKLCQTLSISVETKSRVKASNKISIVISAMVCMSLVAIASVRSGEMFEFHLMVGIPLFAGAPIIHVLQTWISHQMVPAVTSVSTANYRLLLTILCIVCLFLFLAFSLWSYLLFEKDWKTERMRWKSGDAGYVQHVIGNAAEWLYLLSHAFFVLSFSQEFKRLKLYETKFQFELT